MSPFFEMYLKYNTLGFLTKYLTDFHYGIDVIYDVVEKFCDIEAERVLIFKHT